MRNHIRLTVSAIIVLIVLLSLITKGHSQELTFLFDGKPITGTKRYAQNAAGVIYLGFKTSIGKELTVEIYKNTFPKLPHTITFVSGGEGEQMSQVFYFDKPNAGDPHLSTQSGTITITAFDPVAKTISGKFDVIATRKGIFGKKPDDFGKSYKISQGLFTNVKFQ